MPEVNLLRRYPRGKRNVTKRATAKTDEHIRISRLYGFEYFDGPREYGYGGYRYDGRWLPIAQDMIAHWNLKPGDRVLDIGCAKGFLVKDFMLALPGLQAFGMDISRYAAMHCEPEVVGRIHVGDIHDELPFPDHSFDAVVCLNTLHNLKRPDLIKALQRDRTRHQKFARLCAGRQLPLRGGARAFSRLGLDRPYPRLSRRLESDLRGSRL